MGLDISTYTKEQQDMQNAFEAKWGDSYPERGTPEHDEWKKDWEAASYSTDVKSGRYPDNLNTRRYLRSSYNDGGFNTYVPRVTRNGDYHYYWVFAPALAGAEYLNECTDVDALLECRKRAVEVVTALEAVRDKPTYNVVTESPTPLGTAVAIDAEGALALFDGVTERNEESPWGGGYSNGAGAFWPDAEPLKIVAAINGKDVLGQPALHLIYQTEFPESYLESAHVLVEFIDELIGLVRADGVAYMHWSG